MKEDDGKKGRERGWDGAIVEAVTEGVLINNSRLDSPSWFETPFSILISEDVCCALSTRPGLCAGQNQLLAA